MPILDLRHLQTDPPRVPKKYKMVGGHVVRLDPKKRTGITMHQTACMFGTTPQQVAAAKKLLGSKGEEVSAKHARALGVASNVVAFTTGTAVVANPLDYYVYHGNGFNLTDYSIEVEGTYPGIKGDKKTMAGGAAMMELSSATLEAIKLALMFLYEEGRKAGSPLEWINAHRQSSDTRRSDPGEEIWKEAVLGYAVPVLKLKVRNDLILPASNPKNGPGRPIPTQWDPKSTHTY